MSKKIKKTALHKDKSNPSSSSRIVCIGGGTGVSVLLSGLKEKEGVDLSAIVTVFDSGGSSGILRKEMKSLALGDIRQCLITASTLDIAITKAFEKRFNKIKNFKGHSIGNLLLAVLADEENKGLKKAIDTLREILRIEEHVKVMPVSLERSDLKADVLHGNKKVIIKGEENIINRPYGTKILKIDLYPKVRANPDAVAAIKKADLIVFAPGKFYTSIISNLLVEGILNAVRNSKAKKVFVCNLMTQPGNTDNLKVEDFLSDLECYLGKGVIDYVVFNTGKLSKNQLEEVRKVFPKANFVEYDSSTLKKDNFIPADIINRNLRGLDGADVLVKGANKRTMVLHDPAKLAKIILQLCKR